jgi:CheY-like chemotaxis protein
MTLAASSAAKHVVALFNVSDDTADMVQRMLDASGFNCLVGCHFSDVKKGRVDFARHARMIRVALTESTREVYDVEWVGKPSDGLERLTTNRMSAVLLDLLLPDCPGLDGRKWGGATLILSR